jgi:hypothetical protein
MWRLHEEKVTRVGNIVLHPGKCGQWPESVTGCVGGGRGPGRIGALRPACPRWEHDEIERSERAITVALPGLGPQHEASKRTPVQTPETAMTGKERSGMGSWRPRWTPKTGH